MKRYHKSGGLSRMMSIPTALAALRIALLPLACMGALRGRCGLAALSLLLSLLAEIAAEALIRRCDMATETGAALTAAARGLTCIAMLLCLASRLRRLYIPAVLLALRECALRIRRWNAPSRAGDCALGALYLLLFAHLLWSGISTAVSVALTGTSCALMLFDLLRRAGQGKERPESAA